MVAGGTKENDFVKSAAMYDVLNQSCLALPDLPSKDFVQGVVLNDYFYLARKFKLHRICLSIRMKWELVAKGNFEIQYVSTDSDRVFLIGERHNIIIFDPSKNKATSMTSSSRPEKSIFRGESVLMDNKIYIMVHKNVFIFDIANGSWSQASPLPDPIDDWNYDIVQIDRWILVLGTSIIDDNSYIFVYDTLTKEWRQVNIDISTFRCGSKYVKVGSHIITVGGHNLNGDYFPMSAIHIKHIIPDRKWTVLNPYILLRQLIDDNRAAPIIAETNNLNLVNSDMNIDTNANADAVIEKLFTDMPLDVFRYIMFFLN